MCVFVCEQTTKNTFEKGATPTREGSRTHFLVHISQLGRPERREGTHIYLGQMFFKEA